MASGALVRVMPEWQMGEVDWHALFPAGRGAKVAARALADHMIGGFASNTCPPNGPSHVGVW